MALRSQCSHTTVFWRNAPQLAELGEVLAPRWFSPKVECLRVLVCGGSIGCEALSLAIALAGQRPAVTSVEVDASVTARAQEMRFAAEHFEPLFGVEGGMTDVLRARWFDACDSEWRPRPELAAVCAFETADVTSGLSEREFDVVCCQNVLTHHEPESAEAILDAVLARAAPRALAVVSGLDLALKARCAAAGFLPWTGQLGEIHEAFVTHRRHFREQPGRYYFELENLDRTRPDAALRYATLFYRGAELEFGNPR